MRLTTICQWIEPGMVTQWGHWHVHRDYMRDRCLTVVFPLNFAASLYFTCRRVKWEVERWIFKLEWMTWLEQQPIIDRWDNYESPDGRAIAAIMEYYGFKRNGHVWIDKRK